MSGIRGAQDPKDQFFSPSNGAMLDRLLYADFQRRVGADLSDKQKERLVKTVRHYMTEVYSKNSSQPVQFLNKEVLTAVVPDYMSYLRRNAGPSMGSENDEDGMRQDVNTRFSQLQTERDGGRALAPPEPDFRISLEDDKATPALSRFEEIKRQREVEAARDAEAAAALTAAGVGQANTISTAIVPMGAAGPGLNQFLDSEAQFRGGALVARQRDEEALASRNASRAAAMAAQGAARAAVEPPDPRRLLFGDGAVVPLPPRGSGLAQANPTLALPESYRDRPALPQDNLKPQDDVISYRENEYNLYVYSADRDWVNNNTENRYTFSVNFDPANNRPGFGFSPATNIKFKNIVRIEFVKAIMPLEACDTFLRSTASSGTAPTLSTTFNINQFAYPYVQVRIPELNTNGYGTNDGANNAFAMISYEAYWASDSANTSNRGYTRMVPKFLKCQKVFYPTPLATLQKLTFEFQRPDGVTLCDTPDTLDISGIFSSRNRDVSGSAIYGGNSNYFDLSGEFIYINTKNYFNQWSVTTGDRIQIKNVDYNTTFKTLAGTSAVTDLIAFITRPEGHLVCDVGRATYNSGTSKWDINQGTNNFGYANVIVIPGNFGRRANNTPFLQFFGGALIPDRTLEERMAAFPSVTTGRLINLNHQVQVIMRVITRDMDAASRLRPDNLQA
jgi:hypothetical protein